ncbi:hypothetical protein [Methylobacterium sp. WL19]|uniref:hypothetical protein n=1 Tax=Methylobacterium sp. WL19 TaxID=2603896 RepID=UPI0011C78853|nr:hypothetical protein [Methylobacterium sp. WL19]TXN22080.1 hypothetical protein FV220_22405 [Methylobacterium sp. WL19]
METPKHTPTPWQARGAFISAIGSTDTYSGAVWGGIAHATPCEYSDGEGRNWSCGGSPEANAARIVLAVNAYDDLVAVLARIAEGMETVFDEGEGRDVLVPMDGEDMSAIAYAALNKWAAS